MKLITAEEARGLPNKREVVDIIIDHINERVRARKAEGEDRALIGVGNEELVKSLSLTERANLFEILRNAGYRVIDKDYGWPYFAITWQADEEEA